MVLACTLANDKPAYQLDRLAVTREMIESSARKRIKGKRHEVKIDWRAELDREFNDVPAPNKSIEDRGRRERNIFN